MILLWTMIWFAMEKRKQKNFERFWYSHHVSHDKLFLTPEGELTGIGDMYEKIFVVFFLLWQLHGMFCKPIS